MLLERDYESVILIYDLHLVFMSASKRTLLHMHINIRKKILSVLLLKINGYFRTQPHSNLNLWISSKYV